MVKKVACALYTQHSSIYVLFTARSVGASHFQKLGTVFEKKGFLSLIATLENFYLFY